VPTCDLPTRPLVLAICYPHRRLSPHPDAPNPGVMACHILHRTEANPVYLPENLISLHAETWLNMPAAAGGEPTPCRTSQPGSLHCSSESISPLSHGGRSRQITITMWNGHITWCDVVRIYKWCDTHFSVGNIQRFGKLCKILIDVHWLKTSTISCKTFVQWNSKALAQSQPLTLYTLHTARKQKLN